MAAAQPSLNKKIRGELQSKGRSHFCILIRYLTRPTRDWIESKNCIKVRKSLLFYTVNSQVWLWRFKEEEEVQKRTYSAMPGFRSDIFRAWIPISIFFVSLRLLDAYEMRCDKCDLNQELFYSPKSVSLLLASAIWAVVTWVNKQKICWSESRHDNVWSESRHGMIFQKLKEIIHKSYIFLKWLFLLNPKKLGFKEIWQWNFIKMPIYYY